MKFLVLLFIFSFNCFSAVKYYPIYNHTKEQKEILKIAENISNDILKSNCFENFMLNRDLIKTNKKTRKQVVEDLKSKDLSVPVHMYYKWTSKVVGYRQPPRPDIYTNAKFHNGSNACSRASNLLHEWSHVAGYGHSFKATKKRPFSVPYSINAAFKKCCKCTSIKNCEIIKNKKEEIFKTVCERKWYYLFLFKICYKVKI